MDARTRTRTEGGPARRGGARALPSALLLLAAAAAACSRGAPPPGLPRLDDASGVDRLVLDDVQEALAAYEAGDEGAALELALVYEAQEIDALAVRTYEICLSLPSLPAAEVRFHHGRALAAMGRADEAAAAFRASLALDDSYVPAHWRLGQVLLEAGSVPEARASFERALALDPASVAARLGLARVLLVEEDPAGAVAALAPVLERQPNERFAHGLLSRAYLSLGDAARAERELALEAEADHVTLADPLTQEMRKRATGIAPAVRKANDLAAAGKRAEALAVLEPVYARDPHKLAIVQSLAKALIENGQVERALLVLEDGMALHPGDYKLELLAGVARSTREEHSAALAHLERARELNPAYAATQSELGALYAKLGRLADAEQALALAAGAEDAELRAFLALGQVQMARSSEEGASAWKRAMATFARATERFPASAAAWAHLAEAQAQGGERDAARASLAAAEKLNASHPRIEGVRRLLAEEGGPR